MNNLYVSETFAVNIDEIVYIKNSPGRTSDVIDVGLKDGRTLTINGRQREGLVDFINKQRGEKNE